MNPLQKMMLALRALVSSTGSDVTRIPTIPFLPPAPAPIAPPDDPIPIEPIDVRDEEIRKLRSITVHLQEENSRLRDYAEAAVPAINLARDISERSFLESDIMKKRIIQVVEEFKNYILPPP